MPNSASRSASCLIALLLVFGSSVQSKEYYVSPYGTDESDGLIGNPFETISKACTVYMMAGTHIVDSIDLYVTPKQASSWSIRSYDDFATITSKGSSYGNLFVFNANNATLTFEGLIFTNIQTNARVIDASGYGALYVWNCTFENIVAPMVVISSSSDVKTSISHSTFSSIQRYSIVTKGDMTITGSTFTNGGQVIWDPEIEAVLRSNNNNYINTPLSMGIASSAKGKAHFYGCTFANSTVSNVWDHAGLITINKCKFTEYPISLESVDTFRVNASAFLNSQIKISHAKSRVELLWSKFDQTIPMYAEYCLETQSVAALFINKTLFSGNGIGKHALFLRSTKNVTIQNSKVVGYKNEGNDYAIDLYQTSARIEANLSCSVFCQKRTCMLCDPICRNISETGAGCRYQPAAGRIRRSKLHPAPKTQAATPKSQPVSKVQQSKRLSTDPTTTDPTTTDPTTTDPTTTDPTTTDPTTTDPTTTDPTTTDPTTTDPTTTDPTTTDPTTTDPTTTDPTTTDPTTTDPTTTDPTTTDPTTTDPTTTDPTTTDPTTTDPTTTDPTTTDPTTTDPTTTDPTTTDPTTTDPTTTDPTTTDPTTTDPTTTDPTTTDPTTTDPTTTDPTTTDPTTTDPTTTDPTTTDSSTTDSSTTDSSTTDGTTTDTSTTDSSTTDSSTTDSSTTDSSTTDASTSGTSTTDTTTSTGGLSTSSTSSTSTSTTTTASATATSTSTQPLGTASSSTSTSTSTSSTSAPTTRSLTTSSLTRSATTATAVSTTTTSPVEVKTVLPEFNLTAIAEGTIDIPADPLSECSGDLLECPSAINCTPSANSKFDGFFYFKYQPKSKNIQFRFKATTQTADISKIWSFSILKNTKRTLLFNTSRLESSSPTVLDTGLVAGLENYVQDGLITIELTFGVALTRRNSLERQSTDDDSLYVGNMQIAYISNEETSQVAQPAPNHKKRNDGIIAGCVIGGLALLVAAIVIVFVVARNKKRQKQEDDEIAGEKLIGMKNRTGMKMIPDIEVGKRVGGGNFGDVYEGTAFGKTTKVALKQLKSNDELDAFTSEAQVTDSLSHPNCVLFFGIAEKDGKDYIVTEFCDGGALSSLLEHNRGNQLEEFQLANYAWDAAKGMAYLESQNIVHRDLAARNLLVNGNTVKVADFGMSRNMNENAYEAKNTRFPIRWAAPESLKYGQFTSKSDVWSLGVTMWEIYSYAALPYASMNNSEVVQSVIDRDHTLTQPYGCPSEMWDIVKKCFAKDPADRPTLARIATEIEQYIQIIE